MATLTLAVLGVALLLLAVWRIDRLVNRLIDRHVEVALSQPDARRAAVLERS